MKLAHKLRHYFLPHESNNQKAALLHPSSLLKIKIFFIVLNLLLTFSPYNPTARILGYAANISPQEVVRITNEKRAQNGLPPLQENGVLSQAALAKGTDMLNKDYWAHVAPDGTQPWHFFTSHGYRYRFAGENLARDFSNPSSAVDAWMASPTHRENMLSPKYKEIGIGVVEGDLNGVDTTIIVQFFGTKYADTLPVEPIAQAPQGTQAPSPAPTLEPTPQPTAEPSPEPTVTPEPDTQIVQGPEEPQDQVLISPFNTVRGASIAVVGLLLLVLVIDAAITSRRRISRIGGRTFAHIAFLGMILTIILILRAGQVL